MSFRPRARRVVRAAVKRAGGRPLVVARRRAQRPVLSVVMPVYNVAEFLPEALESVLNQSLSNLELIAVDDGSSDGSLEILRAWARRDHRLIVVTQPNAGQGSARNNGVDRARGEFLTFVDSDDTVPHRAYERMVASLSASGSDFSVGSVVRLRHRELINTAWVRTVHSRDRIGVTLEEFPNAMQDIICCNRMFRTSFWRDEVGGFQSHIAYEDHVPMLAAYVRARKFDILAEVTYHWRVRLSSTGHKKANIGNLLDRIEVKEQAYEMLQAEASEFVRDLWVGRALEVDFPPFLTIARTSGDAYRNLITATYRTHLGRASERALGFVRVINKIRGQLAAEGRWDDLAEADAWLAADAVAMPPTRISDGRVLATAPTNAAFLDGLAPRTLEMAALETHFQGVFQSVVWQQDRLVLGGWTLLRGVDIGSEVSHRAWLANGDERIELETRSVPNRLAKVWGRQQFADYTNGGFEVTIPFAALPGHSADWQLVLEMTQEGITASGPLDFRVLESGAVIATGDTVHVGDGVLAGLSVGWTRRGGLQVRVETDVPVIEVVDPVRGNTVSGTISGAIPGLRFQSLEEVHLAKVSALPGGRFRFEATLPPGREWVLSSDSGHVRWPEGEVRAGTTVLRPSKSGGLTALTGLPHLQVTALTFDNDTLTLIAELEHLGLGPEYLRGIDLGNPRTSLPPVQVEVGDHEATLTWSLREAPFGLPAQQVPSQKLEMRLPGQGDERPAVPASRELGGRTPIWFEEDNLDLKVGQLREGQLTFTLQPPIGLDHRGAAARTRLLEAYASSTPAPRDSAFFQCYRGEFATDSQRALDRAIATRFPEMERIWGIQDPGTRIPEGSRGVVMNTPAWFEAIASARFLSNNIDFGGWFRQRDHQSYLQTFHGYPFKSMGIGFWQSKAVSQEAVDLSVARANAEWDTILVPSEFCADLYRQEYLFEGKILVAGYPRTDALVNSDAQQVRRTVLTRLGVDPSKRVVLYAPTYRDKLTTQVYAAERFDDLDLDRLVRRLGGDHVLLLRGHNNNQRHTARVHDVAQIIDVTDYPEINDLTLAADVAVLDYSSLRFDWAITGKPMVFFVPDMEDYFDLRPPLFDFAESAPGPLVRTTDEVIEHLLDPEALERDHRAAISAFNTRFNSLHDGHASERVIDAFFGDR